MRCGMNEQEQDKELPVGRGAALAHGCCQGMVGPGGNAGARIVAWVRPATPAPADEESPVADARSPDHEA